MRFVKTAAPSFPDVPLDRLLDPATAGRWEVVCGDTGHWRVGLYRPTETSRDAIDELERHDCPELFLLIEGRVTLLTVEAGEERQIELEPGRPVLVSAPHTGLCPDGPGTGTAFVVERDAFTTEYRSVDEWKALTR